MLRVLTSAVVACMQGAVSSPLIVAPGVTGGFTGTPAGAGGLALLVLAVSNIATQRLSLCDEVWACPVTRLPDLVAVLPTPVESLILCAEVRASKAWGAVSIADPSICKSTRTVHLGGAY